MGGSSSSSTKRTYQTQNISQQGHANVYGSGNQTTVYRADAITLDNIAAALAAGVEDVTNAGTKQVEATLDSNTNVTRAALDSNTSVTRDAMSSMEKLALEIQQGAEKGTQQAMDFVSNYTEREQIGSEGEQLRTLQYVAAAVAVALVGIAWASKGSIKA
ncbi:hypothetical protein [Vreelandella sulfidaeris]|uniref:hypothetical protein n=1 Tax=Vreelandella sulfidaeris TaxID=115553 RepID=UPI0035E805C2